jgi:hypothetical protein
VADLLKDNATVTELDLKLNDIGDAGATCIFRALKANSSVVMLRLPNNNITSTCLPGIEDMFAENMTLQTLTLTGNAIEDDLEAMDNIETFLVRNLGILAADEDDDTYDPLPSG